MLQGLRRIGQGRIMQSMGVRYSSTVNSGNEQQQQPSNQLKQGEVPKAPEYIPLEYEPFKFGYERERMNFGYTMQELYGVRYGLKHSPAIRKEITKDNIMFFVCVIGTLLVSFAARNRFNEEEDAFYEYVNSDLTLVRELNTPQKKF